MAKPKLCLIPAAQGGKLYSVLPSSGVGDFDFTRSGSATRINSQGLIETVASGVSRLNYPMIDGVVKGCPHHILEPQRLQRVQYSEDFSNAAWTKSNSSITSNSVISPDGSLNADKLVEDTSNSTHRIHDTIVTSSGVVYTQSIFAKSGGNGRFLRIFRGSGTYNYAVFDLDNGTVFSKGGSNIISAKIEKYPNGWYKCSSTFTTQFSNIATYYGLQNGNLDSYTGDGVSHIYIYGAMLEEGSYPTSYIPNYGTSGGVTRSAETANGSGDAATFNSEQGVLMAEISAQEIANASGRRTISLSDGTNDNRVYISFDDEYNKLNVFIVVGTTQVTTSNVDISDQNSFNKITVKYKSGDSSIYVNGFLANSFNDTFSGGNFNTLKFSNRGTGELFYGNTKQLQYYDTALNSEDLEKLTSWVSFQDMAEGQLYSVE